MRVVVTGAGGFVGSILAGKLAHAMPTAHIIGVDRVAGAGVSIVGDLNDPSFLAAIGELRANVLVHLAAVPGGAAEHDPVLSRRTNLDATLDLFDAIAAGAQRPRVVYASTVAVIGSELGARVDDDTPPRPAMTYGAHKLMVEIALADLHRRGAVDGISLRLPGIVARPAARSGLASAFLSDIFHAHLAATSFVCPVAPDDYSWIMSVDCCADNLLRAVTADLTSLPMTRAVTLPALRVRIGDLVAALPKQSTTYRPDTMLRRLFASHPPLDASAARNAGFHDDGTLERLVERVLARITGMDGQLVQTSNETNEQGRNV